MNYAACAYLITFVALLGTFMSIARQRSHKRSLMNALKSSGGDHDE